MVMMTSIVRTAAPEAAFGTTDTTFFANGQVDTVTMPAPETGQTRPSVSYIYDGLGRLSQFHRQDGSVQFTEYNDRGEVSLKKGAGLTPSVHTYEEGRLKSVTSYKDFATLSGASVTTYNYDLQTGQKLSTQLPGGDITSATYENGQLKTSTNARGQIISYFYNNAAQLETLDYSEANMTDLGFTYNRLGQQLSTTGPQGTRSFLYTDQGQLDTETLGTLIKDYDYDANFRFSDFYLKKNGAMLHTYSRNYGTAGRLKDITANGTTITAAYNDKGFSGYTYNDGTADFMSKSVTIDNLGRITNISYDKTGVQQLAGFGYQYNHLNQVTRFTEKSGQYWIYGYDNQDGLNTAQKHLDDDNAINGFAFSYSRNDSGNRTKKSVNGKDSNYIVNNDGQIESRHNPGVIDIVGQAHIDAIVSADTSGGVPLASKIHRMDRQGENFYKQLLFDNTNARNQDIKVIAALPNAGPNGENVIETTEGKYFLGKSNETYGYDDDGNITSDGRWLFTWNQINQLISMETKNELYSIVTPTKLDFTYDYAGNRIGKQVSTRASATDAWLVSKDTGYVYQGRQVVAEHNQLNAGSSNGSSGTLVEKTYVYGPYIDENLIFTTFDQNGTGTNYYPQQDRQFSVRALVDGNANIVESYDYSPFGKMTVLGANGSQISESAFGNAYGYTGRRLDTETGLWFFRARYYSDDLGRFLSRDPLGYNGGGMSMYSGYFAGMMGIDPSGLVPRLFPEYHPPIIPIENQHQNRPVYCAACHPQYPPQAPRGSAFKLPSFSFDLPGIIGKLLDSASVKIEGKILIGIIGPAAVYLGLELEGKTFVCQNAKTKKFEIWGDITVGGDISATIGGAATNTAKYWKDPKGDGNKTVLDYKTGKLKKLKKLHKEALKSRGIKGGHGIGNGINNKFGCETCPDKFSIDMEVGIDLTGEVGAGLGAKVTGGYIFEWKNDVYQGSKPKYGATTTFGTFGAKVTLKAYAKGSFKSKITNLGL